MTGSVGTGSSFGSIKSSSENEKGTTPTTNGNGNQRQSRLKIPTNPASVRAKQTEPIRCKSVDITLNDVTPKRHNEVTSSQRQMTTRNVRRSQSSDSR